MARDPRTCAPFVSAEVQNNFPKMIPLDVTLHESNLPETETYVVELKKDDLGLGITVAGYVCEKGGSSFRLAKRDFFCSVLWS